MSRDVDGAAAREARFSRSLREREKVSRNASARLGLAASKLAAAELNTCRLILLTLC
jgi:hypothetical protein